MEDENNLRAQHEALQTPALLVVQLGQINIYTSFLDDRKPKKTSCQELL